MNSTEQNRRPLEQKLLSREVAAKVLGGVNVRTIDRLVKSGKLASVKLGRRHMITRESAEDLAAVK